MPNIDIKLNPSRVLYLLTILFLISTIGIIVMLDLDRWIRAIFIGITLRYCYSILRNYALLTSGTAIYHLVSGPETWLLQDRLGITQAELCPESTVTAWICILQFKVKGQNKKRSCLILRDSLPPDSYRQLLVHLRTIKAYEAEHTH